MPADYSSTAAALALSPSPVPSPGLAQDGAPPPWTQLQQPRTNSGARRLSHRPFNVSRSSSQEPFITRTVRTAVALAYNAWKFFMRLPLLHRVAVVAVLAVAAALGVVVLVNYHRIFAWLGPVAKSWRDLPGGWAIVWLMTFATAFPPMIGYSTAVTISGLVFGFPLGWPIAATATVAGSTVALLTSRSIFSGYVHSLVGTDTRFVALGQVLRHDGLLVLTAVRFCPLPFSLSNGFLATIPSISPGMFALSTALASPKLLVHVFIGSRLALLAEEGDSMSMGDKVINYISMLIGGLVGLAVGLVVYRRTMARAAELARGDGDGEIAVGRGDREDAADYADEGGEATRLMDPDDADAAALMDDDDISLWTADGFEDGSSTYKDSEEEGAEAAVFARGDGKFVDEEASIGLQPARTKR